MGAQDAALVTARILLSYSPANLVLVGIAGGLADHVLLGDVVIADEVRDYIQDGKVGDKGFSPSGRMYRASGQTKNTLNFIDKAEKDLWTKLRVQSRSEVRKIVQKHKVDLDTIPIRAEGLEIHVGHIASGPVVATSRRFAKWLKATDRKCMAVEMESAGFMNAVYEFGEDARAIVIRGISDKANTKKEALDKLGSGVLRARHDERIARPEGARGYELSSASDRCRGKRGWLQNCWRPRFDYRLVSSRVLRGHPA